VAARSLRANLKEAAQAFRSSAVMGGGGGGLPQR
jgi:hypothetical protein